MPRKKARQPTLKVRIARLESRFEEKEKKDYMVYLEKALHNKTEQMNWFDIEGRLKRMESRFVPMYFLPQKGYVSEVARSTIEQAKSEIAPTLRREIETEIRKKDEDYKASVFSEGLVPEKERRKARRAVKAREKKKSA